MKGKKLGKKYPVSLGQDPGEITDPKKARALMKEVDEVVRPGIIKLQEKALQKKTKGDSCQKHK